MKLHIPASQDENAFLASWAAAELNAVFSQPYISLGIIDDADRLSGVFILNEYSFSNVSLTVVGRGALTASIVRMIAEYVFVQLKCSRVTLRTRRSNHRVRRLLNKHFKPESALKDWYGDEDGFQFRMCRRDCPWLRTQNATISTPAAA